jgi:TonB family protein
VGRAIASLAAGVEVGALSRAFARAGETDAPIPSAVFDPALLRGGALRDAALLYLLEHDADASGSRVLQDLVSPSARANASGWLSVLLELAARRDASAERRDLGPIISTLDPAAAPAGFWRSLATSRLSQDEARALRARVFDDASVGEASPVAGSQPLRDRDFRWARRGEWRTAEPLVAGLDAAIAQAAGCRPGAEEVTVVQVGYGAGGQVRQVRVDGSRASAACRLAASALASLEVAPLAQVAASDRTDYIITAFARDALECERRSSRGQRAQATAGAGGVKEPQKLHDVRPIYPKHLIAARVQGTVIVEAVIDRTGCVNRAAVIGEAHADLNVAALAAITQWRYTPTLLNGEPVPVIVKVNSAFSLR